MRSFLVLLSICSVALAARPKAGEVQPLANAILTQPIRYCHVMNVGYGHVQMTTDWIPFEGGTRGIMCSDWIAYDSFDIDIVTGFPINGDTHCGGGFAASTRWYFGPTAVNVHHISDFKVEPGKEGHNAETIVFGWFFHATPPHSQCLCECDLANPSRSLRECHITILACS